MDLIEIERMNGNIEDAETQQAKRRQVLELLQAKNKANSSDIEYVFGPAFQGMNLSLLLNVKILECISESSSLDDLKERISSTLDTLTPLKEMIDNLSEHEVVTDIVNKNNLL